MTGGSEGRVILGRPRSEGEAQIWIDVLRDEGIEATYFPDRRSGVFGAGGDLLAAFPVIVSTSDFEEAREAIRGLDPGAELTREKRGAPVGAERSGLATAGLLALVSVPAILVLVALLTWIAD